MNQVRSKMLENYRIVYNPRARTFNLCRAWPETEGNDETILYTITEKALIATLLDLQGDK